MRTSPSITGRTSVAAPGGAGARRRARAIEIEADLSRITPACSRTLSASVGLLESASLTMTLKRGLQRVGEIADLGAGALDHAAIGVEQQIDFGGERRDVLREIRR